MKKNNELAQMRYFSLHQNLKVFSGSPVEAVKPKRVIQHLYNIAIPAFGLIARAR